MPEKVNFVMSIFEVAKNSFSYLKINFLIFLNIVFVFSRFFAIFQHWDNLRLSHGVTYYQFEHAFLIQNKDICLLHIDSHSFAKQSPSSQQQ